MTILMVYKRTITLASGAD